MSHMSFNPSKVSTPNTYFYLNPLMMARENSVKNSRKK